MLNPSINDLLEKIDSRYSLVIATSKRAREIILEEAEQEPETWRKPISVAVDEFYSGKFKVEKPE